MLSPCSHAGVVNAALGALGAFGGEPIDVILGGYHLAGEGMEPRIEPTVHDLANRVRPRVVAPGHCTGWRAKAALAHTFAPGATAGLHAQRGSAATMKEASIVASALYLDRPFFGSRRMAVTLGVDRTHIRRLMRILP